MHATFTTSALRAGAVSCFLEKRLIHRSIYDPAPAEGAGSFCFRRNFNQKENHDNHSQERRGAKTDRQPRGMAKGTEDNAAHQRRRTRNADRLRGRRRENGRGARAGAERRRIRPAHPGTVQGGEPQIPA